MQCVTDIFRCCRLPPVALSLLAVFIEFLAGFIKLSHTISLPVCSCSLLLADCDDTRCGVTRHRHPVITSVHLQSSDVSKSGHFCASTTTSSSCVETRDRWIDLLCLTETWHDVDSAVIGRLRLAGYNVVDRPSATGPSQSPDPPSGTACRTTWYLPRLCRPFVSV